MYFKKAFHFSYFPAPWSCFAFGFFQFIWVSICIYAIIYRRNKGVLEEFRLWIEWVLYECGTEGMNTRYVRNQRAVREHLISTKTQTKSLLFRLAILRHFSPGLPSPRTQNLTTTLVSCSEHQLYFCYSISRAIKNCACN